MAGEACSRVLPSDIPYFFWAADPGFVAGPLGGGNILRVRKDGIHTLRHVALQTALS